MRRLVIVAFVFVVLSSVAAAGLKVSVVERPMGVKVGYPVGGTADFFAVFSDEPTTYTDIFTPTRGIHTLPMIKIVVLDDGNNRVILGRVDAIGMSELLTLRVAQYVEERTGENIYPYLFISGTHTHSGPGRMAEFILWGIAMDTFLQEIFDDLKANLGEAIIEALKPENFRDAKIGYASRELTDEDNIGMIHGDRRSSNDELYGHGYIEHTMNLSLIHI